MENDSDPSGSTKLTSDEFNELFQAQLGQFLVNVELNPLLKIENCCKSFQKECNSVLQNLESQFQTCNVLAKRQLKFLHKYGFLPPNLPTLVQEFRGNNKAAQTDCTMAYQQFDSEGKNAAESCSETVLQRGSVSPDVSDSITFNGKPFSNTYPRLVVPKLVLKPSNATNTPSQSCGPRAQVREPEVRRIPPLPTIPKYPQEKGKGNVPPPPNLFITKHGHTLSLSWIHSKLNVNHSTVQFYELYRFVERRGPVRSCMWKKFREIASTEPKTVTFKIYNQSKHHHFAVKAVDVSSRSSQFSNIVTEPSS